MALSNGKLEGLITIPSGGVQALTCTDDSGGPTAVTITAGDYWWDGTGTDPSDTFYDQIESDINDAMGQTWTVALGSGAAGTGKLTIGCTGSTCTVTWNDTNFRNMCGFAANCSGSTSYTGGNHVKGLWLPDGPPTSLLGLSDPGLDESDQTCTESSGGHVLILGYQRKTVVRGTVWQGVSRAKARIDGESTTGESFQQFVRDVIYAEATYITKRQISVIETATDGYAANIYRVTAPIPDPEQLSDGWIEQWRIAIPRHVLVPS